MPKLKREIAFWSSRIDESSLGCDWSDAHDHCWRCGHRSRLQRCHIVPRSLGGSDEPSNIIGLCARCHDEMPNVVDPDEVWRWIKDDHGITYDTYWDERAKRLALTSEQWLEVSRCSRARENFQRNIHATIGLMGVHGGQNGQGPMLTTASIVWVIRRAHKLTMIGERIAAYENQNP